MSIIINGMKMPRSCGECKIRIALGCCGTLPHNTRVPTCPVIELPPHGRLIDADAMIRELEKWSSYPVPYIQKRNLEFIHFLKEAETVIEAEVDNDTDP